MTKWGSDFFKQRSKLFLTLSALLLCIPIGLLDYFKGAQQHFSFFYFIPISLIAWYGGIVPGVGISLLSAVPELLAEIHAGLLQTHPFLVYWNTLCRLAFYLVFSICLYRCQKILKEFRHCASLHGATLEATADGILVVDESGKIVCFNKQFVKMWRIPDSIISTHDDNMALEFVMGQLKQPESFLRQVRALYADPEAESFDLLEFKDGRFFERSSNPHLFEGKGTGRVWRFHDVTENKLRLEAMRDSQESLRNIFDTSQDAIVVADPEQDKIIEANASAHQLLGWSPEKLIGEKLSQFHPNEMHQLKEVWNQLLSGRVIRTDALNCTAKSGKVIPVEISFSLLRLKEHSYALAIIRDITDRKVSERALALQAEALRRSNAELEQFAYIASHDLKEPLRAIASYLGLLREQIKNKLDQNSERYIQRVVKGVERMHHLINDLLLYSQIGRVEESWQPVNSAHVLARALENLKVAIEESQASITWDHPLPTISFLETELLHLFQNLIGNAIKYKGKDPLRIHLLSSSDGERGGGWIFKVKDNGIGIEARYFDRIFKLFQRLHSREEYPGTGIGLAICKKIVERHGGRIWVESEVGSGSTFSFTIPPPPPRIKGGSV